MKNVFTIIKVMTALMICGALICLICASYNIEVIAYAICGGSLTISAGVLGITYTRQGRMYFSNIFRCAIYLMLVVYIIESIDSVFNVFTSTQFTNTTLALTMTAFVAFVAGVMIDKQRNG